MAGVTAIEQYVIDRVREMRKQANISQATLAAYIGVSEGHIGEIESTKRNVKYTIRHLNELAKIFNCSPKDFLPDNPL